MSLHLDNLEESFDNESAERILNLSIGKLSSASDIVRKSMYDFDLETPGGIYKLMNLLPIMDSRILKDIMAEIWPGYEVEEDARRNRMEIKGYLKDYLDSYEKPSEGKADNARPDAAGASA